MTNKERYQRAFSALHASEFTEEMLMKKGKTIHMKRVIALCAAAILILALSGIAYAADIGGIQRTVQIWVHGDQTDAVLDITQGEYTEYTLTYEDEKGEEHQQGGGGMAIDMFGRERPLTEEEILAQLDQPDVVYQDDGTIWVYYHSQAIEITDKFNSFGVCRVQVKDEGKTLYMTIKRDGGYSYSTHSYTDPG